MRANIVFRWARVAAIGVMLVAPASRADDAELDALKKSVEQMQQTINTLNQKIDKLERERQQEKAAAAAAPALAAAPPAEAAPPAPTAEAATEALETILTSQGIGSQAPVDPRGFVRIPNTGVMLRFNAKPRVDFTYDTANAGDDSRFVTAKIPVTGDPTKGGGPVFNANGKGSQLVVDVRAPDVSGSPRFYYQNDFFGSGSAEFNYRIQQLFGSIYNVTIGQTFSPFEDPDIWPDTVDYEGPNSMIFARFPLARYKLPLGESWALNGGLTQPDTQATDVDGATASGINHTPDFAFNLRGESADLGHVQLSTVFRDLSAKSATLGKDSVFGWGLNLAGTLNIKLPWKTDDVKADVLGGQFTYGEGLGRYGNDSGFFPTDAAFNSSGDLKALPYYGAFGSYTHHWLSCWRSTGTFGWVKVDGLNTQGPDAYHQTQYASGNLVWQLRERLSVGYELLYGNNQKESGASGHVFRNQVGVAYSIF
jgi:uncharacterized small protein (DUF1192 family)